jgi:predicted regulator of Ras-like GTPase activity (Roadblock/LC7/MglB family)
LSIFSSRARELRDQLLETTLRIPQFRGLLLADSSGLPLVSTLHSRPLEEALAAFAGVFLNQMERAQQEFEMGPLHQLHIAGRNRQVLVVPVERGIVMAALVDSGFNQGDATMQMLALAREILETLQQPPAASTEGEPQA